MGSDPIALFADWSSISEPAHRSIRTVLIGLGYQLFQPSLSDLEKAAVLPLASERGDETFFATVLGVAVNRYRPQLLVTGASELPEARAAHRVATEHGLRLLRVSDDGVQQWVEIVQAARVPLATREVEAALRASTHREDTPAVTGLRARGPELSVIVPTAGRPVALRRLLEALAQQTLEPSRFEVVVTDDGTDPPVEKELAGLELPFRLELGWQENRGPAAARNRAIAQATGDYLLILNDDAGPAPDLLERHLEAQRAARTPRAYLGRFDFAPDCVSYFAAAVTAADLLFPYGAMDQTGPNAGRFFWTCNLSVPREAVLRAGGFDESFRLPLSEDVELGYRLEREGVHVFFLPEARCLHHHHVNAAWFERRQVELGRHMIKLYSKHHDPAFLPWAKGHPDLGAWAEALEREVRCRGGRRLDLVQQITALDGTPDLQHSDVVLARMLPLIRRMNEDAMRLGLVAGLRDLSLEQVTQKFAQLVPLTSLVVYLSGSYRLDRIAVARIRGAAGTPVEIFGLSDGKEGETLNPLTGLTDSRMLFATPDETVGALRNRVLKVASGEYIGFLATSCQLEPDWLARLVRPLVEDPTVGAVGPRIEGLREPARDARGGVARLDSSVIIARREAIEQTLAPDGDHDFQERMKRKGYRLVYVPEVVVRQAAAEPAMVKT